MEMRIRVVSDGTRKGTQLTTEDGTPLEDVRSLRLRMEGDKIRADVTFIGVPVSCVFDVPEPEPESSEIVFDIDK